MYFKDRIPEKVLNNENTEKFVKVLDELNKFKTDSLSSALRIYNPVLTTNKKWIVKMLADYGVEFLPLDLPLNVLQQFLLNVDTIMGIRGSRKGIELFCSVTSMGEVTIDDSGFYSTPTAILLNSDDQGVIVDSSDDPERFLVGDSSVINPAVSLTINVASKYFGGTTPTDSALIKSTLESCIGLFLGFSPNRTVTFNYSSRANFYYHNLLNSYFV